MPATSAITCLHACMFFSAISAAVAYHSACNLNVHGFSTKTNLNGNYDAGVLYDKYASYELRDPPSPGDLLIEFTFSADTNIGHWYPQDEGNRGWIAMKRHESSTNDPYRHYILARCSSDACKNATDLATLSGSPQVWEVPTGNCTCGNEDICDLSTCNFQPMSGQVTMGCCSEKPVVLACKDYTQAKCQSLGRIGCLFEKCCTYQWWVVKDCVFAKHQSECCFKTWYNNTWTCEPYKAEEHLVV